MQSLSFDRSTRKKTKAAIKKFLMSLNMFRYECGPGQEIRDDTGQVLLQQKATCQWDKSWLLEPSLTNPTCEWTHCLNPPEPPDTSRLKLHWNGEPVLIGEVGLHNFYFTLFLTLLYRL